MNYERALNRCAVLLYAFLVILCPVCTSASVNCFVSTEKPDEYKEGSEEGVTGCSLESPIKFDHGIPKFLKLLKLGMLREAPGEASCKFTKQGNQTQMGKLKDEAFMNPKRGIRILCSCYSHGCNGMYESFEKYAGTIKSFLECNVVSKLVADMKKGNVRGPTEGDMRSFFKKHSLPWPRQNVDDGSLFTVIAIVAGVLFVAIAGLSIVAIRIRRAKFERNQPVVTAIRGVTTRGRTRMSTAMPPRSAMQSTSRSTAQSTARSAAQSSRMRGGGSKENGRTADDLIGAVAATTSTAEGQVSARSDSKSDEAD